MAQGYYSLEEAAQILGVTPDELKRMGRRNELRPFFDRGTMRFRTQDVDQMAQGMGRPMGESQAQSAPPTAPASGAASSASPPGKEASGGEVFNFNLPPSDSDQVEIGQEILSGSSASLSRKSGPKLSGPESPMPTKKPDSGVKLSKDSGMIPLVSDSDVKMVDDPGPSGRSGPKKSGLATEPKSGVKKPDSGKRKSGLGPADSRGDSGVRLVPMEGGSDSDVKIVPDNPDDESATVHLAAPSPEDSDIRISPESDIRKKGGKATMIPPGSKETMQTEEIDLDAELRRAEGPKSKTKTPAPTPSKAPPQPSPFELSEGDLALPTAGTELAKPGAGGKPPAVRKDETALLPSDESEEVQLGELSTGSGMAGVSSHDSGINLQAVSDSGISLEKPAEDAEVVDLELKPEGAGSSSKVKGAKGSKPPSKAPAKAGEAEAKPDDSEFELTLDDSGLAPLEEETATAEGGEKDIFETDFEMPALEDESGFEPVPLEEGDTDLESSDFDLALGEEDIAAEEESGSQVVALEDEEEADEAAATVARTTKQKGGEAGVEDEEGIADLLADEDIVAEEEAEEEGETLAPAVAMAAPPTQWGVLPVVFMLPCVLLMFFLGVMTFEVLHTMWGYHQPYKPSGLVVNTVTGWFLDIPENK